MSSVERLEARFEDRSSLPRRFLAIGMSLILLAIVAPGAAASSLGSIDLTKTCDAPDHCTVQTSLAGSPLPVGTEGFYLGPWPASRLSSEVLLVTPGAAGTTIGHCTLSFLSASGTCTFARGTGTLAGFHANLSVGTADWVTFVWQGTYHFGD